MERTFDKASMIQTAQLEKLRVGIRQCISPYLLDAQVDFLHDSLLDEFTVRAKGFVWAEQVQRQEVQYPADWWQAFKKRWFPRWLKARHPVQYRKRIFDVKAVYPNFKPAMPTETYRLHLLER